MVDSNTFTPYSTAMPYVKGLEQWMSPYDAQRCAAYTLYERMYWNDTGAFAIKQRGSDADPIYIPSGKNVIEATNRYLAVDWDVYIDPEQGQPADQEACKQALDKLFRRENLWAKFSTQKRYALIRGDALWHLLADPLKDEGSRISVHELDPASYFAIYDIDDLDKLVGCHIVDQVEEDGKAVIRRLTYRKDLERPGIITSETALYEMAGWDDRDGAKPEDIKRIRILEPLHDLPAEITQLPVYHWKNIRTPADPYGSSEMRGLERIAAAINQTISDQDLAVSLTGLGMYTTTSTGPVDADGNEVNWLLGPGRVLEHDPETTFERLDGITTVSPSLDHARYLGDELQKAAGVPAIATGDVEVQAAESGIALYLRLSPILAKNKEKELELLGITDNMLYDLVTMWFPAYEGLTFTGVSVTSVVGDPMPENRQAKVDEIIKLATSTPPLISLEMAQAELTKLGYSFGESGVTDIVTQQSRLASANDPYAARLATEPKA